jgi:hypothetical protein
VAAIFAFKCAHCANVHEGSPSFAYDAPYPYLQQPESVQKAGMLGSDLCHYADKDGRHNFIRVCLEVPIHGVADPFVWGVWVSLSQTNYDRYVDTSDSPVTTDCYFGWFCNALPYYPETRGLKTHVRPREGDSRPFIVLEETDHPLSIDYHNGISIAKAQEIAEAIMHQ